jgi:hypothetical protein
MCTQLPTCRHAAITDAVCQKPCVLTSAAGMVGKTDIAGAALQELRRAQPNISLAWIAGQMPIKREADREHDLEGFRRAGLG